MSDHEIQYERYACWEAAGSPMTEDPIEFTVAETDRGPVRVTATAENADALWRALGLRRTRSGQWSIDGRRYRSRRLALDSLHDRLARRMVLYARGRIEAVDIRGTFLV